MNRLHLALFLCITTLWGQNHDFSASETLVYTTGFRLFTAGTSTLEVVEQEGDTLLHVVSQVRTSKFFDRLYRIRDRIDLWLDPDNLVLRRMQREINEGRYKRKDTTIVDSKAGIIYARGDTLTVEGPVFDPIGVIYYLRGLPLAIGDEIHLSIFNGRRLQRITITVRGPERIKVPAGEFECLVLKPAPLNNQRLTKVDGLLQLWLTLDERRMPVRLEQESSFGTMVLKLTEVR
ncbi:MAG: DUF3108 domain-containing protein [Fidelibacterota bacterium]|nr:MAG: DUF3108 domain-containing protein [Candidatus Neomarinimicrobiota bacterium]